MKNPLELANIDIQINKIPLAHFIENHNKKVYSMSNRELFCLALIKKGSLTYISGDEKATAHEGEIMKISKGETYTLIYNENFTDNHIQFYIVEFDIDNKDLSFLKRINKVKHPDLYLEIFRQLEKYCNFFHVTQGGYLIKNKALLYELIYNLFKEIYKTNLSPLEEDLEKARNYIDTNIKEKITIENLAEISGYSVPYFKRKFKEFYKITPGEYIIDVKINKAKAMLESKIFSVKEIANECGFSSESYFSHAFKHVVGCSPKDY